MDELATRFCKNGDDFPTLDALIDAVMARDGISTVKMKRVRSASGFKKLGCGVNSTISNELKRRGLSHAPAILPLDQNDNVLLYRSNIEFGTFADAVASPHPQTDHLLRAAAKRMSEG
jgi:hypothetical protein